MTLIVCLTNFLERFSFYCVVPFLRGPSNLFVCWSLSKLLPVNQSGYEMF